MPDPTPEFELTTSRHFPGWLAEQRMSLGFTTYQAGKLFLIGMQPDGRLSIYERSFGRAMGLHATAQTLWMSSSFQLWRFENMLEDTDSHGGHDRVYSPHIGYTTGDLDVHDVAVDGEGRVVFVNTLFSCLATTHERYCFAPLWRPPFVSRIAAEDRCHLNGLAMDGGVPTYVTAVGRSDVTDGWREQRRDGGCVVDVMSGEIVVAGLSMPHSPRVYRGDLWLLESGAGYLSRVSLRDGAIERVAFCPGYARGLAFTGDYAVVGLSDCRENRTFGDLPLEDELVRKGATPRCGLLVVDLRTGDTVHWLRLQGVVRELYDVAIIPGVIRPMLLGFKTDEIKRMVSVRRQTSDG